MESHDAWSWLCGLSCACSALWYIGHQNQSSEDDLKKKNYESTNEDSLKPLHRKYLVLFFIIRLADWLQVNMFNLYLSYDVDVATLFMTGFFTSAICSLFIGKWVDTNGRKLGCLVYCVLEAIIQGLEHYNNFWVLFVGRVLGGISTALLFSAFESWIISEHRSKQYSPRLLSRMFSIASTLNGVSAVMAGLVAKVAFTFGGEIGPFQVALALSVLAGVLIFVWWDENYGGTSAVNEQEEGTVSSSFSPRNIFAELAVFKDLSISAYGFLQSLFEGSMYVFVFMWTQTFMSLSDADHRPPTEILFSSLMVSMSIGGIIFETCTPEINAKSGVAVGMVIFFLASLSMGMVAFALSDTYAMMFLNQYVTRSTVVMIAFCLFECCVGMYEPWMSTMRSIFIPNSVLATAMTWIRVPLNIFVYGGVQLTENYSLFFVFLVCSIAHFICLGTLSTLPYLIHQTVTDQTKTKKTQ